MADFATQGRLEQMDFRKMIDNISLFDMTGSLDIRPAQSNDVYSFIFVNGAVSFVHDKSNNPGKMLGTILYRSGIMTKEELAKCLAEKDATSRPFGEIILSNRHATQQDITRMLHRQIEDIMLSIAMCTEGSYFFNTHAHIPDDPVIDLNITNAELVNRYYLIQKEWQEIKDEVPSLESVIVRDNELLEMAQPNDHEKPLIAQLATPTPFHVILDANIHNGKLMTLKLLVSLINRHFIKILNNPASTQEKKPLIESTSFSQIPTSIDNTASFLTTKRTRFSSFFVEVFSLTLMLLLLLFIFLSPLPATMRHILTTYGTIANQDAMQHTAYSKTVESLRIASMCSPSVFSDIALEDGWGTPLKIVDEYIVSAGPDTEFATDDDLRIAR